MSLWEEKEFRTIVGQAWRPGGLALTRQSLDWIAGHLSLRTGLAIDLGCGACATLNLLAEQGFTAIGIDLCTPQQFFPNTYPLKANLLFPPLKPQCADLVLLECVLSLQKDPIRALQTAFFLLKKNGVLLVSDLTIKKSSITPPPNSCLSGARAPQVWSSLIQEAGFLLHLVADHSHALAELMAKLIWYGQSTFCSLSSFRNAGYGVWIAQR
ncbi:MAG: class I SAM-dependent methyltransferase [Desulfovibrio sp.]|nr:class I SAM-dependent methyltransferase [Desulfovibrio sp.]